MGFEKVTKCIKENKRFLITTHINPEGDAIGSEIALALILKKLGKSVVVCNTDPVPRNLQFLPYSKKIKQAKEINNRFDAMFVLDCGSKDRVGLFKNGAMPSPPPIVNIDHHITNEKFGYINYIDAKATATGDIIYRLAKTLKIKIDKDIATAIYTTLLTETGSFRYSNTNSGILRISAELIDTGLNPWRIGQQIYETNTFQRLKLLGTLLDEMEIDSTGKIAWVIITSAHYAATNTTVEDVEDFINFPRSIKGVETAILFRESEEDLYKISFRSRGTIDVTRLALKFGGGGHKYAAGCTVKGSLNEVKKKVLQAAVDEMERIVSKKQKAVVV